MKPSNKSPEIDQFITSITGIDRKGAIKDNICALCGKLVSEQDFRDPLSLKEYTISGMCQECQDDVFGTNG
jgi:hypothetical protein